MSLVNWISKALLLASLVSVSVHATEYTVHGPDEFIRHYAQPLKQTLKFSVPNEGSSYILRVHNGWGDARRVRAARITLNGVRVFGPRDFHKGLMDHYDFDGDWGKEKSGRKWRKHKKNYAAWDLTETIVIDKSVALLENNTIEVVLYGIPQRKSGFLSGFLKSIHRYLPPSWQSFIENGSGLAIEVLGSDDELPEIVATATPSANPVGWHNSPATIEFNCTDSISGIANCSDSITIEQDGELQIARGTATDNAGNTATTEFSVNLDTTSPVVSHELTPGLNQHNWSNQVININYTCVDELSGIGEAGCPLSSFIETQGANQKVSTTIEDIAGNSKSYEVELNIDLTAPVITPVIEPAANAAGWHNANVNMSFICSDVLSGIKNCANAQVINTEGVSVAVNASAHDFAGNSTASIATINLDKTPPIISQSFSAQANSNGWYDQAVTVSYVCSDALSGLVASGEGACPQDNILDGEGESQTVSALAADIAGNQSSISASINIDKTVPVVVFTFPLDGAQLDNPLPIVSLDLSDNLAFDSTGFSLNVTDELGEAPTTCSLVANVATCSLSRELIGQATLKAKGLDLAGNETETKITVETNADSDRDGVPNSYDQCPNTLPGYVVSSDGCDPTQRDTDKDGVIDINDAFPEDATETADLDGDGTGDNSDTDVDGDGVENSDDVFPRDAAESKDLDKDGIGDNADTDRDGDGVPNVSDAFPEDKTETSDLDGDGQGDNTDLDVDGDGVNNDVDLFPLDGSESADLDGDGIGDNSDPDTDGDGVLNESDAFPKDATRSTLPIVTIDTPATLTTVGHSPVAITGTVDPSATALTVNGLPVTIENGAFAAEVAVEEGHNTIVARMVDESGIVSTASINVSLDLTPPYVTIDSHKHGQIVYSDTITVTGLLNDIVRGTIEAEQASVTVNGVTAEISNRSYSVSNVLLTEGENTLTVVGSDQVGNTVTNIISLTYKKLTGRKIELVSGNHQTASIHAELELPLIVKVLDDAGLPLVGKNVIFRVSQGSGVVASGDDLEGRAYLAQTDDQGLAQTKFKLGRRSGVSNQKVRVRVVGYEDEIIFTASATVNIGNKLSINSGNNQRGGLFQPLPAPFIVAVTDAGANTVQGARVKFEVRAGGGLFQNKLTEYEALTDSDGRASAHLTLGGLDGLDKQLVRATLLDAPLIENEAGEQVTQLIYAGFSASGLQASDPSQTSISGVVLDNQDNPLPGVTVRVDGTTRQAIVDEEGRFTITEAPVGPVHLIVDGSTTTVEGEYPALSYNLVTVSGAKNPMAAPIYMVKLNTENAVWAGEEDVALTLPEVPGFKLEVPAGSVTFPDGSREGMVSVTVVNSSKVPMAPPNGMQPQFIVTIQPTGAMFDAPARLTLPNVDAHKPGAQVEMFSYDHDLEEFVAIGLGTVSEDGSTVRSNPGVGVIKAGWHCGASPGGSGTPNSCGDCAECDGTTCQPTPDKPAKNQVSGNCQEELCQGSNPDNGDTPEPDAEGNCSKSVCINGSPGSEVDDSDTPEDNPGDCVDPVCTGPPAPDDGETPDQDCMECKGGGVKQVEGHVKKREQKPDDCKVLYCDGDHEPAPNEPLPQSAQAPGDCKEKKCDGTELPANDPKEDTNLKDCQKPICNGTSHDVAADSSQAADDTDMFDCKKPSCDGMKGSFVMASSQHKKEEITDACNKTSYECAGSGSHLNFYNKPVIEKVNGTPLDGDKVCKVCKDGKLSDVEVTLSGKLSTKKAFTGPSGAASRLLSKFVTDPSKYSPNWGFGGGVEIETCCKNETKGEKYKASGEIGASVSADVKIWPRTPKIDVQLKASIGDRTYGAGIEADGGVFLAGSASVTGSATIDYNTCDGKDCITGEVKASGTLSVLAKLEGEVCLYQGRLVSCGGAGAEASGSGTLYGNYKGGTCDAPSGNGLCFEGIKVSGKVFANITIDGEKRIAEYEISTGSMWGGCE